MFAAKFDFHPNALGRDLVNALRLAEASQIAYKKKEDVPRLLKRKWGMDPLRVRCFDKEDTQAFLVSNEDVIFIAFRGTEFFNLGDWFTDFDLKKEKGPFGKPVHRGFLNALNEILPEMTAEAVRLKNERRTLWVTGHSLGGALATLFAAALYEKNNWRVNGLYTFGSPRVGHPDFCSSLDPLLPEVSFRFDNDLDIVPMVPPESWHYAHIKSLCYFKSDGKLMKDGDMISFAGAVNRKKEKIGSEETALEKIRKYSPPEPLPKGPKGFGFAAKKPNWLQRVSRFFWKIGAKILRFFKIFQPEEIKDHSLESYIAALKKNL